MPKKSLNQSLAELDAAPGGVLAVDRALSVLGAFAPDEAAASLAELSARTQLHKSTLLRLLASLQHAMLVERQADGRYALGWGITRLHQVQQSGFNLEAVVGPALRELVAQTGESAALHALWRPRPDATPTHRVSLYRVDSPQPIRDHYKAGDLVPLRAGGGAIVLSAFGLEAKQSAKLFDAALLQSVRERGFVAGVGLRDPEVGGISAPVFQQRGAARSLLGALILTMPASRFNASHTEAVVAAAARLSTRLGA
jgi:DNA-binding IclR family transcriptional regulator